MKLVMHRLQPLLINVGVDLRRRNIGVSEHFLDDAQIGAVAEQMGRETVTEQMRINVRLEPGTPRHRLHDLPDARRSLVGRRGWKEKLRCRSVA